MMCSVAKLTPIVMNHISGVGDKFDDEINDGRIDNMNFWGASSGHGT